jgi:RimJ/RimL family protein N-acetyltransferase
MTVAMSTIAELLSGSSIVRGNLTLRAVDLESARELANVARGDIHAPDYMPFGSPWSDATPDRRVEHLFRWYTARLAESRPDRWTMIFSVIDGRELVGSTNLYADSFSIHRTVSTGSWLLRTAQGRGIGTAMREMLLLLAFDRLGAEAATSEAWHDNWPSRRVNEKCGYQAVGSYIRDRLGTPTDMVRFELSRQSWAIRRDRASTVTLPNEPRLLAALR